MFVSVEKASISSIVSTHFTIKKKSNKMRHVNVVGMFAILY